MKIRPSTYVKASALALVIPFLFTGCFNSDNDNDNPNQASNSTFTQVDRMGLPAINTVFNHPKGVTGFSKTTYNQKGPNTDVADYTAQFVTVLGAVANKTPAALASALLPDELPAKLKSDTSGFANLDGRKPQDDAVDIALTLVIGDTLAQLHSDHVNANDKPFSTTFPYLAVPNTTP